MIQDMARMALKAQTTGLFGMLGDVFSGMFGGSGGVSATAGAYSIDQNPFLNMAGFADGGSPPIGVPSLVGERGPELFVPKTSGTIIPNNQLSSALNSQPSVVYNAPVIQNMSAIDTQSGLQFLAKNKSGVWSAYQSAQRALPMKRG
jgi:phage-related minor tail protein